MKKVLNDSYLSVFCFEMAELLGSGILAGEGFLLLSEQEPDAALKKQLSDIYDETFTGGRVCDAMERTGLFPEYMLRMIRVGEETGSLPDMLTRVATTYDGEVDDAVNAMTSIIEPIMILFLAGIVGTIVVAMFSPLMGLLTKLGG